MRTILRLEAASPPMEDPQLADRARVDANAFAEFLLKDFALDGETVMVAPADGFYATPGLGRDEVRIAYVLEEPKLRRAMTVLAAALVAYPGRVAATRA